MTTPPGMDLCDPPSREWRQTVMSGEILFYALMIVLGTVVTALAPFVFTGDSTTPPSVPGGLAFLFGGVASVAQGVFYMLVPAWRVLGYDDGRFIFVSRRYTLTVGPGELRSIRCLWLDPNRLLPMWVKASTGSILVFPRMPRSGELFAALQAGSPKARITPPLSKWF